MHGGHIGQVPEKQTGIYAEKGLGCPSGYVAGLTNQTSLVRFPSPLNFS